MGLSFSMFSFGKSNESGDATVEFVDYDKHFPPTDPKPFSAQNSPERAQLPEPDPSPISHSLDLSPRQRATKFGQSPNVNYVTRDEESELWKSDYSPSPVRSQRTSPCSYKMTSENILAYPSPSRLHSPPLSYTNNYNQMSPRRSTRYRKDVDQEDNVSLSPHRKSESGFFYSSVPSPTWKPISEMSPNADVVSQSPYGAQGSWAYPSSEWNEDGRNSGDTRSPRTASFSYYCDEAGFNSSMQSPRETRYF